MTKQMDHAAYKSKVRRLSPVELRYIIKDAGEAVQANPTGPNVGYYLDEINYAAGELKRRESL